MGYPFMKIHNLVWQRGIPLLVLLLCCTSLVEQEVQVQVSLPLPFPSNTTLTTQPTQPYPTHASPIKTPPTPLQTIMPLFHPHSTRGHFLFRFPSPLYYLCYTILFLVALNGVVDVVFCPVEGAKMIPAPAEGEGGLLPTVPADVVFVVGNGNSYGDGGGGGITGVGEDTVRYFGDVEEWD